MTTAHCQLKSRESSVSPIRVTGSIRRLDAALDMKRELAPQKEILCLDRPARSECESAPAERLGDQLK